jgi:PAS domain S-box-containing protein
VTASVLLVDDRAENLLALRAVLEPLECRTVAVTSGEAALKELLNDDFAVVLLDVQMPGMDGFETAELIKKRERTRTVPIIFVTAISKEREHVFRGYTAGAVDYLFKPYDPGVLRSKVRVFLELEAKSRAAAETEALLRATFASAPVGMARLDLEGRCAEVNQTFAALLGYEPAELHDRLLGSLVDPGQPELPGDWRAQLAEGRTPKTTGEVRLMRKTGEAIPCQLTFAAAMPGHGLADAIVVGVQDLRERQRADSERERRIREQVARAEAERVAEHQRVLHSISDAAMATHDFDDLVGELLRRTIAALGVDTGAVVLTDEPGQSVTYHVAGAPSGADEERYYTVVTSEADALGLEPVGDRSTSTLVVPMHADGDPIGTLHVGTLFERRFTTAETGLLQLAADRVALAIQRARLFQREHAIAEELQRSLLPARLPAVDGITTAARYFAAESGAQVGGDWYDAVIEPGGRLVLTIGDVAGRGIKAASTMGQLRSALRAYALDGHAPVAILERLNAFQLGMDSQQFATVGVVSVAPDGSDLIYACAGHPPALVVGPDGVGRWLEGALGPPLGVVPDAPYSERTAPLDEGATLILYTDGLVERRTEVLDAGFARLEAVAGEFDGDLEAMCEAIIDGTLLDRNTDDDVTLLVLRRAGGAAPVFEGLRPGLPARQLAAGAWPHPSLRSARVELTGGPGAGAAARQIVDDTLSGVVSGAELSDLRSVVAEVVNNAVVHGGATDERSPIVVHLAAAEAMLRVEASSDGPPFTPSRPSARDTPGGFGLVILDRIASRWGVDFDKDACIWFEIDRA